MSNYENPPNVNDSCMVCMEIYKTKKNIHIPPTCVHHLCTKCVKRCKECPYCKTAYPKIVKEKTPAQCMTKHIYFLRKNMYQFQKMVDDNRNKFGTLCDIHYNAMLNTMVTHIVLMEKELQNMLPVAELRKRKRALINHPYNNNDLDIFLYTNNLMDLEDV